MGLLFFWFSRWAKAVFRYESPVKQSITSLTTTRKDIVYAEGEDRDGDHNGDGTRVCDGGDDDDVMVANEDQDTATRVKVIVEVSNVLTSKEGDTKRIVSFPSPQCE